jgi:hypothetical protein
MKGNKKLWIAICAAVVVILILWLAIGGKKEE